MSELQGNGPLFKEPDPSVARAYFREHKRPLVDKRRTVTEAITELVQNGDYLAPGGFGGDRIATALLHEIVRQERQSMGFAGHTTTHDFQIMCAGNQTGRGQLLKQVDISYIVGLEARGLSPHARRVAESGEVELCEWSNFTLALRFQAAAMGVPFLPVQALAGTDTFVHSAAKTVVCPFTGHTLVAVPALWPDVALIHVHEADRYGNCRIRGTTVADYYLARAAKRVIISCERIIDENEIRSDPSQTIIPFYCVDAVCEVPLGSYPGNMPYEYFSDEQHLREWLDVERDPTSYLEFAHRHLFDLDTFEDYLRVAGAHERLPTLREQELSPERSKP